MSITKLAFEKFKSCVYLIVEKAEKKNIDVFFIFPCLYLFLGLVVFYSTNYDYVYTWLFLFAFSFLHYLLVMKIPYINTSDYYKYLVLRENFIKKHRVLKNYLTPYQKAVAKYVTIGSFLMLYKVPEYYELFVFTYMLSFAAFAYQNLIEIYTLVKLPQLPQTIKSFHPFYMQKRYSPYWSCVFEKLGTKYIPICGRVLQMGATGLGFLAVGTQYVKGGEEMDPIRMRVINIYHGLPVTEHWTEGRMMLYQRFHRAYEKKFPESSYADSYAEFVQKEALIADAAEKVVKMIESIEP